MIKRVSRVYLLGVLLLAAIVLLTACGSDNKSSASNPRTATSSASRAAGASSSPRTSSSPASGTRSPSTSSAAGPEIKMIASLKFDKTELTIDANKPVTVTVNNTEDGIRHNFALYKTKADADADKDEIGSTKICSGPCKETLELNLEPGKYFFHCDVHPQQMTGTLSAK